MGSRAVGALALGVLLSSLACAADGPTAGADAPGLEGKSWVSPTGGAPDLKGKVHAIEFWFAG